MSGGGDEDSSQLQSIVHMLRSCLCRDACLMERPIEPISAPISREHPPGAISPMSRRGEADDQTVRGRIAEVRHGAPPIHLIRERLSLLPRNLLPPFDQSRAANAGCEFGVEGFERKH